ncbi:MAG: hypothetical protein QOH06_5164 [Acidobacteriota bacterium]|jgi:hypothetical protein|nr:hypothetical protein [Acidobacteriota bacterium]
MPLRGTQNWGKMSQSALFQSSAGVSPACPDESAERRPFQGKCFRAQAEWLGPNGA